MTKAKVESLLPATFEEPAIIDLQSLTKEDSTGMQTITGLYQRLGIPQLNLIPAWMGYGELVHMVAQEDLLHAERMNKGDYLHVAYYALAENLPTGFEREGGRVQKIPGLKRTEYVRSTEGNHPNQYWVYGEWQSEQRRADSSQSLTLLTIRNFDHKVGHIIVTAGIEETPEAVWMRRKGLEATTVEVTPFLRKNLRDISSIQDRREFEVFAEKILRDKKVESVSIKRVVGV